MSNRFSLSESALETKTSSLDVGIISTLSVRASYTAVRSSNLNSRYLPIPEEIKRLVNGPREYNSLGDRSKLYLRVLLMNSVSDWSCANETDLKLAAMVADC